MKNRKFDEIKQSLNITEEFFRFIMIVSLLWIAGWALLLIPQIRSILIATAELFFHHPFQGYAVWHESFVTAGLSGIVLYIVFFLAFFHEPLFDSEKPGKKLYFFVYIVTAFMVFLIMFRANWLFGDDHAFIRSSAINKYPHLLIFPEIGRFQPFGYMHYNALLFVFRLLGINSGMPVSAHFVLVAISYMMSVFCLYLLFKKISPHKIKTYPAINIFFVCLFPLLSFAFQMVFMQIIFTETVIIALFSFFMLMYYKGLETDKKRYYIAALVTAVYVTYCKEPVFGALLVLAFSNHLFRYKDETKKEKLFYTILIINGILFLVLYYFLSFKYASGLYNDARNNTGFIKFIAVIFVKSPILAVMFLTGFIRLYHIVLKKDKSHLYYDSLLFAGMAYTFAYVLLRLNAEYYFLPSVILFLPSLIYWTKYFYQKNIMVSFGLFLVIIMICNLNFIVEVKRGRDTLRDRRDFIPHINSLLSEYNEGKTFIWYEQDNAITEDAFYQVVKEYKYIVENYFLNYINRTEDKIFFTISRNANEINFDKNVLFFYPAELTFNEHIPDDLLKILNDNNFEVFSESHGILIYKYKEHEINSE